jgi:hypothetical protein
VRDEVIGEYRSTVIGHPDPMLATLMKAIFLEDALGVTVPESDLVPGGLADPQRLLEQLGPD